MTRSKDSLYSRHERQLLKNQAEVRMKKMGAGSIHWGTMENESDVEELVYTDVDTHTINNTSTKIYLVDPQTFQNLRHEQLS